MGRRHTVILLSCELIFALFSHAETGRSYLSAVCLHYQIRAHSAIDWIVRLDNIP